MRKHDKDDPLTFTLFPNNKKQNAHDGKPDFVGKVVLEDGTIMRLAGWKNKLNNSEGTFIGGKMSAFLTKEEVAEKNKERKEEEDELDLPF